MVDRDTFKKRVQVVLALPGHSVKRFSEHHFRVDGVLDLWPSTCRFYNLQSKAKGFFNIEKLAEFVSKQESVGKAVQGKTPVTMEAGRCSQCGGPSKPYRLCDICKHKPIHQLNLRPSL